jgi:leucyl aminopeptidase
MPLDIAIRTDDIAAFRTPLLVLQHFEDDREPLGAAATVDEAMGGLLSRLLARRDFRGKQEETLVVYPPDAAFPAERVLLVGIGKREEYSMQGLRKAVGTAVRQAERMRVDEMALALGHVERKSEHMGRTSPPAARWRVPCPGGVGLPRAEDGAPGGRRPGGPPPLPHAAGQ